MVGSSSRDIPWNSKNNRTTSMDKLGKRISLGTIDDIFRTTVHLEPKPVDKAMFERSKTKTCAHKRSDDRINHQSSRADSLDQQGMGLDLHVIGQPIKRSVAKPKDPKVGLHSSYHGYTKDITSCKKTKLHVNGIDQKTGHSYAFNPSQATAYDIGQNTSKYLDSILKKSMTPDIIERKLFGSDVVNKNIAAEKAKPSNAIKRKKTKEAPRVQKKISPYGTLQKTTTYYPRKTKKQPPTIHKTAKYGKIRKEREYTTKKPKVNMQSRSVTGSKNAIESDCTGTEDSEADGDEKSETQSADSSDDESESNITTDDSFDEKEYEDTFGEHNTSFMELSQRSEPIIVDDQSEYTHASEDIATISDDQKTHLRATSGTLSSDPLNTELGVVKTDAENTSEPDECKKLDEIFITSMYDSKNARPDVLEIPDRAEQEDFKHKAFGEPEPLVALPMISSPATEATDTKSDDSSITENCHKGLFDEEKPFETSPVQKSHAIECKVDICVHVENCTTHDGQEPPEPLPETQPGVDSTDSNVIPDSAPLHESQMKQRMFDEAISSSMQHFLDAEKEATYDDYKKTIESKKIFEVQEAVESSMHNLVQAAPDKVEPKPEDVSVAGLCSKTLAERNPITVTSSVEDDGTTKNMMAGIECKSNSQSNDYQETLHEKTSASMKVSVYGSSDAEHGDTECKYQPKNKQITCDEQKTSSLKENPNAAKVADDYDEIIESVKYQTTVEEQDSQGLADGIDESGENHLEIPESSETPLSAACDIHRLLDGIRTDTKSTTECEPIALHEPTTKQILVDEHITSSMEEFVNAEQKVADDNDEVGSKHDSETVEGYSQILSHAVFEKEESLTNTLEIPKTSDTPSVAADCDVYGILDGITTDTESTTKCEPIAPIYEPKIVDEQIKSSMEGSVNVKQEDADGKYGASVECEKHQKTANEKDSQVLAHKVVENEETPKRILEIQTSSDTSVSTDCDVHSGRKPDTECIIHPSSPDDVLEETEQDISSTLDGRSILEKLPVTKEVHLLHSESLQCIVGSPPHMNNPDGDTRKNKTVNNFRMKRLLAMDPNNSRPTRIPGPAGIMAELLVPRAPCYPHPLRYFAGELINKECEKSGRFSDRTGPINTSDPNWWAKEMYPIDKHKLVSPVMTRPKRHMHKIT